MSSRQEIRNTHGFPGSYALPTPPLSLTEPFRPELHPRHHTLQQHQQQQMQQQQQPPHPQPPQPPQPPQQQQVPTDSRQESLDIHAMSTHIAQTTLQNVLPHFDRFWNGLGTTFHEIYFALSQAYDTKIENARTHFQELAKIETQRAVNAQKLLIRKELQSFAEKCKNLQKDNNDRMEHIESMEKLINEFTLKYDTVIQENRELKGKLKRSENELAMARASAIINRSTIRSEDLQSEIVKVKKSLMEKFETQLAQVMFESVKYKKRCADLEQRLKDINLQQSVRSPLEVTLAASPPDPDERLSLPAIAPFRSLSPTPIKTEEPSLIFSDLPELQEIIDLTDEDDVYSAPAGQPVTGNSSYAGSHSVMVTASTSHIPIGPFTLNPAIWGDENETEKNDVEVEHRAKRRRIWDDAEDQDFGSY